MKTRHLFALLGLVGSSSVFAGEMTCAPQFTSQGESLNLAMTFDGTTFESKVFHVVNRTFPPTSYTIPFTGARMTGRKVGMDTFLSNDASFKLTLTGQTLVMSDGTPKEVAILSVRELNFQKVQVLCNIKEFDPRPAASGSNR